MRNEDKYSQEISSEEVEIIMRAEEEKHWQEVEQCPTVHQLPEVKEVTKQGIADDLAKFETALNEGQTSGIDLVIFAKYLEELAKGISQIANESAVDEFEKYSEKELTVRGVKLEKRETGVRYDFSGTPKWHEIREQESVFADARKALEKQIKTFTKPGILTVDDEVIDVVPPVRTSKTSLVRTLK
jgi:hypothetical protein